MSTLLIVSGLSLFLSLALMPSARRLARRIGLVDQPDGHRKMHEKITPVAGGLVVLVATVAAMVTALFLPGLSDILLENGDKLLGLLLGGVVIFAVGVADDYYRMRGRHKLIGQIVAVSIVISLGGWVRHVHLFGIEVDLGWVGFLFTMLLMVGAINSLNLLDGMDGLLGSVGLILSLALAAMAVLAGHLWAAAVALALAGALIGFLCYNLPPASVFLGDSGSMLVGLVLGTLAIHGSLKAPATIAIAMPFALMILPIFDTTAAIVRRKLTGRSIYTTDRGHLHHCLLRVGFSARWALLLISVCSLVACVSVFASQALKNEWIALVTASAIIATLIATKLFGHAEAMLIKGRLLSMLLPSDRARHMEVRLQGSVAWKDLWEALKILAHDLNLQQLMLDVNAPILHEGYHARWDHAHGANNERPRWYVEIPMTSQGLSVGRLVMSGWPDQQPVWDKIALLMKVVEDFNNPVTSINGAEGIPFQPPIAAVTTTQPKETGMPVATSNLGVEAFQM
jgi:UDP-GlcNAc:undecaprenyl-phosphate GlcNAc-1-phosphate transferase